MGIAQSTWTGMKEEGSNPRINTLLKILEYDPDINSTWLFLDIGEMLISTSEQKVEEPKTEYKSEVAELKEEIKTMKLGILEDKKQLLEIVKAHRAEIYNYVQLLKERNNLKG